MKFSDRAQSELQYILKKLSEGTFDETNIKDLLLIWRSHFPNNSMVWELACFVAHTEERDRGVYHKELNVRYVQMVYGKVFGGPFNKTLQMQKMRFSLFKALFIDGVDLGDEEFIKKQSGLNKHKAKEEAKKNYKCKDGICTLKPSKDYTKLEGVLKGVLNCMSFKVGVDNQNILTEFKDGLQKTIENLNLDYEVNSLISGKEEEILICIMCLLHSHDFLLYDKEIGSCELSLRADPMKKDLTFSLDAAVKIVRWSLMEIKPKRLDYFDIDESSTDYNITLKGFHALRDIEGNLKVTNLN